MEKYSNYVPLAKMTKKDNIPSWLVVHCSASDFDDFKSIQRYHVTDPAHLWENIGYHYVIERGGKLVAGRPENYHGAHVAESDTDGIRMNNKSIGICICGSFEGKKPDSAQTETLRKLLKDLSAKYNIPKSRIKPHRFWAGAYKTCFGSALPDDWAARLLDEEAPKPPVPTAPVVPLDCDAAVRADRKSTIDKVINFLTSLYK